MTQRLGRMILVLAGCALLGGCMPEMDIETLKQMKPQRPPELDRLNPFVGTWKSTGTFEMAGLERVLSAKGTETTKWACDGWCLLSQSQYEMEELGGGQWLGVWTYDPKADVFKLFSTGDGQVEYGTARFDEDEGVWKMKMKSKGSYGSSTGKGWIRFVGDDRAEYEFEAYTGIWPFRFEIYEMEGEMVRQ